jgi:hypothetical protein
MKFAAGDTSKGAKGAQTGKRAGSMDGKEFLALLEYLRCACACACACVRVTERVHLSSNEHSDTCDVLQRVHHAPAPLYSHSLMPEGVSKTFAMDTFKKSKAKGAGTDKSELDLPAFESAMRRICRCRFLHTHTQTRTHTPFSLALSRSLSLAHSHTNERTTTDIIRSCHLNKEDTGIIPALPAIRKHRGIESDLRNIFVPFRRFQTFLFVWHDKCRRAVSFQLEQYVWCTPSPALLPTQHDNFCFVLCSQVGADFTTLHIPPEKPQESQPSIPTNKGKAKAV